MSVEQKLALINLLYYIDASGVVCRLEAPARLHAEQLVRDNPRLTIHDLLPRLLLDPPSAIPTI